MKIALIGFGAAAIGFLERIKNEDHEIHIFEKSKDIYSSSISGIRADGKLFVSKEMGGSIDIDIKLQKKMVDFYTSHVDSHNIERGNSFKDKTFYRKFYEKGFMPIASQFFHIGTDQLKKVLFHIFENYKTHPNLHFHFNQEIKDIDIMAGKILLGGKSTPFDAAVVAVGRSGHKLVNKIIKKSPELITDNTKVDLGIRFELPNLIVDELNKEMYEFKVKYKCKTGYMVRTFCNNPSGFVVTENYNDFITVNGHAKLREKSKNTNFAILTTVSLTEPFDDPVGYGSYIAKLTNILTAANKVILQTYDRFRQSKRSKHVYRVKPTLNNDKFILGDINLAYPRRVIESIIDFIENLDKVVHGVANPDNLVYAPEIKFYSNKMDNAKLANLKFIGDCSGHTRSIIYASSHGYMMADSLLKDNK